MIDRLVALTAALVLVLLGAGAAPAHAAPPLSLGFLDDVYMAGAPEADPWIRRTDDVGADIVRIQVGWPAAPDAALRPPGFDPRDPAAAAYDFTRADAAIRAASAHGLAVLASFSRAPRWAEGANRPASAPPGSWEPDPAAVLDYGVALATRYSGAFADPLQPGQTLPRVKAFQVWNEPNLALHLSPQWRGGRTFAPGHYRRMLRAFYSGVKSVQPDALVVTAGTAPFGDPRPGGNRIMPARFVRDLLCLRRAGSGLRPTACPAPAQFDVLAHHPYSVGDPGRRALNADDVSIPDLGKLTRSLRAAERFGGALPRIRHRFWVTEVSYDSGPPDPHGVPIGQHASYLQEAFYRLWREGVDTIMWFQIRDGAPQPSYDATNQSGVFFGDGQPKPAARAFRFPLFAERASRRMLRVWGRSPLAGQVSIQRLTRAGWRTVRSVAVGRRDTFLLRVPAAGTADRLRASIGAERSLVWAG
ncbi:MAG: hypothetical protein ACR2H2_10035 [Solirubrobacteraceae bacterium]